MLFGDKVRALAEEHGLERADLIRMSGISKQNFGKIWNNRTKDPRASTIIKISEAFGISPVELISGIDFEKDE